MEMRCESKVAVIRNEYTVTLHGARGTFFLNEREWQAWSQQHPPQSQNGVRRNVTAQPTSAANKEWRFGSRY